jgi:hypothetical protein
MTHWRTDESISQKLNLRTEAQQFQQQFYRYLKMSNVGRNMKCAYISDVEEILTFKTFKGFKKQVACELANN